MRRVTGIGGIRVSDEGPSTDTRRKPVLAGYSITDTRVEDVDEDRANIDRIRNLIVHFGTADLSLCSQCEAMLDARSMATLKANLRWEALISALLLDHSRATESTGWGALRFGRSLGSDGVKVRADGIEGGGDRGGVQVGMIDLDADEDEARHDGGNAGRSEEGSWGYRQPVRCSSFPLLMST
jgi:hypothetical protein